MKCPLCCEFVPNEELLQDHYLTTCSGLAEESDEDIIRQSGCNKKKFQYISPTTQDKEIYFLSTSLETPQVTLVKVSEDLFQSEEIVVPDGTFEGQLVIGQDVLSVAPFTTTGTIITLHVTRQEFDTWSTHSSRSSSSQVVEDMSQLRHSVSMSSLTSPSTAEDKEQRRRRRTLSDQSSAVSTSPKDSHNISSDSSSLQGSQSRTTMAERTSSKDSIHKGAASTDPKLMPRRKRRHRRFHADSSTVINDPVPISSTTSKALDCTLVNEHTCIIQEKEVQDLKAEISKLRIENRKQAKELNTLSKVIDGPLGPQTEGEIIKRENTELKHELSELRKVMLRQEQSFTKKIGNTRQDPVEDWKRGQIDKLHRQLAEAEQRAEECLAEKLKFEEEVLRAKDKICQLRETRDTLRSTNDSMNTEMKKTTEKLESEISELHSKYLAQGRELGEAEKLSQSADNMRGLVERLTIENEELTRQNSQLTLQTSEFEKMMEKLKNKISSLEIELEYKRKREIEEEEKKWKKRDEEEDGAYLSRRQTTSRQHPLIHKSDDIYKSTVPGQLNFNDDDLATSTPLARKSGSYLPEQTRKSDYHSPTKVPDYSTELPRKTDAYLKDRQTESYHAKDRPTESYHAKDRQPESYVKDRQTESYVKDRQTESYVKDRQTDSYLKDRQTDYLAENTRKPSHSESEFDVKPADNHADLKYSKPFSYTKPTAPEEDDTYREALAIVEKYKKLDMSSENTATENNEKPKAYNNLSSSVYDRMKVDSTDSSDKRKQGEKKWSSSGLEENNLDYNNINNNESCKPWSSTAWLRQQNPETAYNGGATTTNYNGSLGNAPTAGYSPSNGYGPDQMDYTRSAAGRRYDTGLRSSYCGKSYTVPGSAEKNTSGRVRMRESDDETDKAEPRPTKPPQNISDVQLGSRVVFKRGTELERGTVRYAGRLVGKDGQYLGIELSTNSGNHDGTYQNHTYFKCKPKRGIFIPINKVQLVYPSV